MNTLACKTLAQLDGVETENVVFSPLSTDMALSMAANGAGGNTLRQMQDVLCPDASLSALNSLNAKLLSDLPRTDVKAKVRLANSLWYSRHFKIKTAFAQLLADSYNASATAYDPDDKPAAAAAVNAWAEKATEGIIRDMLTPNDVADRYMLADAAYFKATWAEKFKKGNTRPGTFTCADGTAVSAPMMHGEMRAAYGENEGIEFAALPFGNKAYWMGVVLPPEGQSIVPAMTHIIELVDWQMIAANIDLTLTMPRFTVASRMYMEEAYKSLGITDAFNPESADFSAISDQASYISRIKHACEIRVDEDGAEAAAVTVSGGDMAAGPGFELVLDRPFGFFIIEKSTGTILFMGLLNRL
ncbi:MAG: hypothetical protein J6J20_02965 [Muribaculaceae bacterium]|nr:hypothetical protein [Muribaculaceae bacterium]